MDDPRRDRFFRTAGPVERSWRSFREHSDECRQCRLARSEVCTGIKVSTAELWEVCCEDGRRLLEAWDAAMTTVLESTRERMAASSRRS
jgi:hypothetical protein